MRNKYFIIQHFVKFIRNAAKWPFEFHHFVGDAGECSHIFWDRVNGIEQGMVMAH